MSKARNALLIASLLTGIMIAGCSDSQSGNQSAMDAQLSAVFKQGAAISASFTDSRVAGMKGVAENGRLRLFVDDQTGAIAVLSKQGGEVWYSNPPERASDSAASGINKDLLSSQLKLDFYNNYGQISSINSYTDSVAHKQMKLEEIPGGVKVSFQFGTIEKTAEDLPKMISASRFEELSGKLNKSGKRALLIAYTKNDQSVYERNDSALNGLQLQNALQAFQDAGYTDEDLKKEMTELHFTQTKTIPRIFQASIEYRLDDDSLVVNVPVSGIRYPKEYPVNDISVLSFFGAAGKETKGSIFVPDGSGALIHFNNGKTKYPGYQQTVYGTDRTMDTTEDDIREQAVRMPVFGLIREDSGNAVLGIIEKGDTAATINADIGGRLNSYNYVYPSFYVINKGEVTLDANGQQRSLPKFQESPMKTDFTVRYVFLSGKDASYQGMARYYQHYLETKGGLPQVKAEEKPSDLPFYLQLVGSISKKKHFVGIPYRTLEPLTTFEQAKSIVSQMQKRDIRNIKLKYSGWFNGGLDHEVPDHVSVDGAVGGSKGLRDFASFTRDKGVAFFPDAAILNANTGAGFNETKEASRTLKGVPATLYPLDPALNRRDRSQPPAYVVSPRYVGSYMDTMLKRLNDYQIGALSLRDLADELNSDYRKHNQIDRSESATVSIQALSKARKDLIIMADGGNAYALPYLTDVTNAPLSNSRFKLEDEEIPFFQMVIRGFISYTGKPYNLSTYTDSKQYILKCLEYGAGVSFEWIYEPNYSVKDSDSSDLYAVNYAQWIDKAAAIYQEVNKVLKGMQNERIAAHEKLSDGVYKTVYENGTYVIVNYNRSSVTVDGQTVEAESYLTGGEQS